MTRGIFFASGAVGAILAGAIMLAALPSTDEDPARPSRHATAGTPADGQALPDAAEQIRQWAADSLARPLFTIDRRPVAQARPGSDDTAGLPRLSGIMITPAGRRAIFATTGGGKPQVVGEGGSVGHYLLQSIAAGEVTLIGPDGRHSLHPTFDHPLAPARGAPPVVAGQVQAKVPTQ